MKISAYLNLQMRVAEILIWKLKKNQIQSNCLAIISLSLRGTCICIIASVGGYNKFNCIILLFFIFFAVSVLPLDAKADYDQSLLCAEINASLSADDGERIERALSAITPNIPHKDLEECLAKSEHIATIQSNISLSQLGSNYVNYFILANSHFIVYLCFDVHYHFVARNCNSYRAKKTVEDFNIKAKGAKND